MHETEPSPVMIRVIGNSSPEKNCDGEFIEMVRGNQKAVFTFFLRLGASGSHAEDLTSETFLRAYRALVKYSPEKRAVLEARPWLITIALNLWRNHLRDSSRQPMGSPLEEHSLQATTQLPEAAAISASQAQELSLALSGLCESQRVAVVLRHINGMPYAEIATVLKCPEGTAKSLVSRGVQKLQRLLLAAEEAK